jgi:hypothetical protein
MRWARQHELHGKANLVRRPAALGNKVRLASKVSQSMKPGWWSRIRTDH